MLAQQEVENLQKKIARGELPPDEPVFVLRARDAIAAQLVEQWVALAMMAGCPKEKTEEARQHLERMRAWPVKQMPGLPSTRRVWQQGINEPPQPPSFSVVWETVQDTEPRELHSRMQVCPVCGNKRCPRAESLTNPCLNTNDPARVELWEKQRRHLLRAGWTHRVLAGGSEQWEADVEMRSAKWPPNVRMENLRREGWSTQEAYNQQLMIDASKGLMVAAEQVTAKPEEIDFKPPEGTDLSDIALAELMHKSAGYENWETLGDDRKALLMRGAAAVRDAVVAAFKPGWKAKQARIIDLEAGLRGLNNKHEALKADHANEQQLSKQLLAKVEQQKQPITIQPLQRNLATPSGMYELGHGLDAGERYLFVSKGTSIFARCSWPEDGSGDSSPRLEIMKNLVEHANLGLKLKDGRQAVGKFAILGEALELIESEHKAATQAKPGNA